MLAEVAEFALELVLELAAERRFAWAIRLLGVLLVVGGVATLVATSVPVAVPAVLVVVGLALFVVPWVVTVAFDAA